ncbi:MAG: DUF4861 family protein [Bacteroidota bacterium]
MTILQILALFFMKKLLFVLVYAILFLNGQALVKNVVAPDKVDRDFIEKRLTELTTKATQHIRDYKVDSLRFPRSINPDNTSHSTNSRGWTSGFYPGTLWQLYNYSKEENIKKAAQQWTAYVEKEKYDRHTHDLGFKLNCSHGQAYEITRDPYHKEVVVTASETLIKRYNPTVKSIRSWDFNREKWAYPVIIDNMMNLEMLFEATAFTGDSTYHKIAHQHALTTLENHFRDDHSSYHVIDYDPRTGKVRHRHTHQGYSDESAWARGQAWGLYGFTLTYGKTRDERFLEKAKAIANFFFTHENMPEDLIPYWDFNAPKIPNEPKDVSAATIATSALLELMQYDTDNKEKYLNWVDKVLSSLHQPKYQTKAVPFFLSQSTGHLPGNSEINVPICYADYYYVEALLRRLELYKEAPTDQVQAILQIQDKAYDDNSKAKITHPYTPRKKVSVPKNLGPQNKWVMFEGPVLENDKIAYRFYMDSRHRFDIYGKTTPNLVMDTVGWDYHDIMDWGSDILKVGNSLGIGSPAIYLDGEIITFSDFEAHQVEVSKDENDLACIISTFKGLNIKGIKVDVVEEWCLEAGSPAATVSLSVTKGELPDGAVFTTGVVKHLPFATIGESDNKAFLYTWGKQSFHHEDLGMAVLVNKDQDYAFPKNKETHLMTIAPKNGQAQYQFLAAWERDVTGVKHEEAFKKMILAVE